MVLVVGLIWSHGMTNLVFGIITPIQMTSRYIGLLEVDIDPDCERYMVLDRVTGELLWQGISTSNVLKIILPIEYSVTPSILFGILDDDAVYDCKFIDGVLLEAVDANTVNMSQ